MTKNSEMHTERKILIKMIYESYNYPLILAGYCYCYFVH